MKQSLQILLIACCLCVIVFTLVAFVVPASVAGNKNYENEYYYNDFEKEEVSDMNDTTEASAQYDIFKDSADPVHTAAADFENQPVIVTYPAIVTDPDDITVLINRDYPLPAEYIPQDLVYPSVLFNFWEYSEKRMLREEAAQALETMFEAAQADGIELVAISGYRSYERQKTIYENNLRTSGKEQADLYSATPGCSEHQSGLSIDVSSKSAGGRLEEFFAETPEGKWLKKNCYRFGYIIRYPKNKEQITGYAYEPWHIRYVGKKLAKELKKRKLCLEEYYGYEPSLETSNQSEYGVSIDVEDSSLYEQ